MRASWARREVRSSHKVSYCNQELFLRRVAADTGGSTRSYKRANTRTYVRTNVLLTELGNTSVGHVGVCLRPLVRSRNDDASDANVGVRRTREASFRFAKPSHVSNKVRVVTIYSLVLISFFGTSVSNEWQFSRTFLADLSKLECKYRETIKEGGNGKKGQSQIGKFLKILRERIFSLGYWSSRCCTICRARGQAKPREFRENHKESCRDILSRNCHPSRGRQYPRPSPTADETRFFFPLVQQKTRSSCLSVLSFGSCSAD